MWSLTLFLSMCSWIVISLPGLNPRVQMFVYTCSVIYEICLFVWFGLVWFSLVLFCFVKVGVCFFSFSYIKDHSLVATLHTHRSTTMSTCGTHSGQPRELVINSQCCSKVQDGPQANRGWAALRTYHRYMSPAIMDHHSSTT